MGYETTLVIGEVYDFAADPDSGDYVSVIATYDLSKPGYDTETGKYLSLARKIGKDEGKFFYFYPNTAPTYDDYELADAADRPVIEDRYGDRITEVNRKGLIAAMQADNKNDAHPYRRFTGAISLLRSFNAKGWKNSRLVVLQYGH